MIRAARGNRPESGSGCDNLAVDAVFGTGIRRGPNEDGITMLEKPLISEFAHTKPGDTPWVSDGLREFFLYRDLGIAAATGGRVIAQLVKASEAPEKGTGWHRHEAEFHVVLMLKGWAKFMYETEEHLVAAGDCVHQRPGIRHFLFDYSPDMEYLEVVGPADFPTIDVEGPCAVPAPAPWK
jgi:quercetin dioxygenase-like cupin family protein